jgi:hypothetical protein
LPYEGGQGWISMVLVDPAHRHQGLATRLMDRCVHALRSRAIAPVLDATPAGAQVYRRIGFVPGFELDRWQGDGPGLEATAAIGKAQVVLDLDRAATGLGRGFVLTDFMQRAGSCTWLTPEQDGFVLVRRGHRAWQLGPLVARDETSALLLLRRALAALGGRIFIDVPRCWAALTGALAGLGFTPQRGFVRMAWSAEGAAVPTGPAVPARVFVLAGPEFG